MIRLTNEQGMVLLDLIEKSGDVSLIDTMGKQVSDQLSAPSHEADLIDTISKVISQRGRVRNILTDDRLDVLRSAIYSPRDLMRFNSVADSISCSNCGHALKDEHVAAVVAGSIYCSSCFTPTNIDCIACRGSISFYEPLRKLMVKHRKDCEHCAARKSTEQRTGEQRADAGPTSFRTSNFSFNTTRTTGASGSGTARPVRPVNEILGSLRDSSFVVPTAPQFLNDPVPSSSDVEAAPTVANGNVNDGSVAPVSWDTTSWLDDDGEDA